MKLKYTYSDFTINLLTVMRVYHNGTWLKVKPLLYYKDTLIVENIDTRLPLITIEAIDLQWHFTTAQGKQLKSDKEKLSFKDKLKFVLRSSVS